ncbi:MAG: hypothetical protein ACXVZR_00900 [Terriglobales bacterium]|jgi:hypothetical protein|nr:hypothetical protein [Terriglobales bacterium]
MSEEHDDQGVSTGSGGNLLRYVLLAVAMVYVIASLYFIVDSRGRIDKLEAGQTAAKAENAQLLKRLGIAESSLKAETQVLAEKVGLTQKEIASRSAALQREQRQAEQRITEQTQKQVGAVSGEVAGVRTDLGGAKSDIAATRTELEATKSKLERVMGDLNVQSGLIAHTRDDLEVLKHRGDRNIYEFSLQKGGRPTPVSTVSLQLKKVDGKKGKFTLNVMADDRTIEKKDRTLFEPLQFYTGRDRNLYEVVVMSADKNKITGYLSAPKGAPVPTVQQ